MGDMFLLKLTASNVELAQVENEIEKLINTLLGANATLLSCANTELRDWIQNDRA